MLHDTLNGTVLVDRSNISQTVDFSARVSQYPSRGLTTEQHWNIWHSSRFSFVNKSDRNVILAANQSFSSNEIKLAITKTLTSGEKHGIFIPGKEKSDVPFSEDESASFAAIVQISTFLLKKQIVLGNVVGTL